MFRNFQLPLHMIILLIFFIKISASLSQCPPKIVKQPSAGELLFEDSKSFLLECEAEGEPLPEYRWIKDSRDFDWKTKNHIVNQIHGTLNFTEATIEDEGQYQCFANNIFGTATSNSVMAVMKYNYLFENEQINDSNLTVFEGEPFSITCNPIPTGKPKPKLGWLKLIKGGPTPKHDSVNDSRITYDPNGTLWFSFATINDSNETYLFAPKLNDKQESLRCPTELKVERKENGLENFSPELQYATPKNQTVILGEEIELFCIYSGRPLPEIVWFKNNSTINIDDKAKTRNYNKRLIITNITIEDKGTYMCNVSNVKGFKSHIIELDVLVVPIFNIAPSLVEKTEGETAIITCEASGHPEPIINWTHNGRPLSEALSNPRRIVTSNSITITLLTKNDTGNYGCNASNIVGYVYLDVYINVLDKINLTTNSQDQSQEIGISVIPELNIFPKNVEKTEGETAIITCEASGHPEPIINWTHNGRPLSEALSNPRRIVASNSITITSLTKNDTGNYGCNASNIVGYVYRVIYINVLDKINVTTKSQDQPQESGISEWLAGALKVFLFFVLLILIICIIKYNTYKKSVKIEEHEIVCDLT